MQMIVCHFQALNQLRLTRAQHGGQPAPPFLDERVRQRLRHGDALLWVKVEHLVQQIGQLCHLAPLCLRIVSHQVVHRSFLCNLFEMSPEALTYRGLFRMNE
jgi:hypothetical protein